MGEFSLVHWLVVLAIGVLLFGTGKLPKVMGDVAKGIRTFKAEMKDAGKTPTDPQLPSQATDTAAAAPARDRATAS